MLKHLRCTIHGCSDKSALSLVFILISKGSNSSKKGALAIRAGQDRLSPINVALIGSFLIIVDNLGLSEIYHLHIMIVVQHHIAWLQVSVGHILLL